MLGREQLAGREEELGEFTGAAEDYKAAHTLAKPGLYYPGAIFKIDMGQARSLRNAGNRTQGDALCGYWKGRVVGPGRIFSAMDHGNGAIDWGGSNVAQAIWEFSCRDFNRGVHELLLTATSRVEHPSDAWGDDTLHFYLEAPLDALESAFMSKRQVALASRTRAIRSSVPDSPTVDQLSSIMQKLDEITKDVAASSSQERSQ